MTHEEAADVFECMKDDKDYLGDYLSSQQLAAIDIAAAVCAEKADAIEKIEQGFEEWWKEHWDEYFNEGGARHIYFAGYAAARASMQAQIDADKALYDKIADDYERSVTANENLREQIDAANARVAELERQRDEMIVKIQQHVVNKAHHNLKMLTASADCVALAGEVARLESQIKSGVESVRKAREDRSPAVVRAMGRANG